jgi:outer membrane protein assembly factor BamE (lipoprotein component of BamABCDE complex)
VKKLALGLALASALAASATALAAPAHSSHRTAVNLPQRGVLVPGKSLAGVKLGDTEAQVRKLWGSNFKACGDPCTGKTWFYTYQTAESLGVAVTFKKEKVVALFTLGSPAGWRTTEGLRLGEGIDKVNAIYGSLKWKVCIGYGALSMRATQSAKSPVKTVTSIYTNGEAVYGFALTLPSEPVCQ